MMANKLGHDFNQLLESNESQPLQILIGHHVYRVERVGSDGFLYSVDLQIFNVAGEEKTIRICVRLTADLTIENIQFGDAHIVPKGRATDNKQIVASSHSLKTLTETTSLILHHLYALFLRTKTDDSLAMRPQLTAHISACLIYAATFRKCCGTILENQR